MDEEHAEYNILLTASMTHACPCFQGVSLIFYSKHNMIVFQGNSV